MQYEDPAPTTLECCSWLKIAQIVRQLLGDKVPQILYQGFALGPYWRTNLLIGQCFFYASLGEFFPKKIQKSPKKFVETEEPEHEFMAG